MSRVFAALTDYLDRSGAILTAAPLSMAVIGKTTALSGTQTLVSLGISGSNQNRFSISLTPGGSVRADARDGVGPQTAFTGAVLSAGVRFSALGVFDTASISVYLNGGNGGTNGSTRVPSGVNYTLIGKGPDNTNGFKGELGLVALWNAALTEDDAIGLHAGASPNDLGPAGSLISLWDDVEILTDWYGQTLLVAHATTTSATDLTNQVERSRRYFFFALPTPTLGFDVSPAVQSLTASSVTVSLTPSGASTVYGVAQKRGLAAPSIAQVKAGQDSSGAAAPSAANKSVSAADTLVLSGLTKPIYDLYFVLNNGGTDSALATIASVLLTPPTGKQYVIVSMTPAPRGYALGDGASPAVETGDVWIAPTATPAGFQLFLRTNGEFFYVANSSRVKQTILASVYDLSADTTGADASFTANNALPGATEAFPMTFSVGTVVDIDLGALYPDPEGDPVTVTKVSGPAWLTVSANHAVGTAALTGTAPTEQQTLEISVSDGTDATAFTHNFSVVNPLAPDVKLLSLIDAAALLASFGFIVAGTIPVKSTLPVGTVTAQDPPSGTTVSVGQAFTLTVVDGPPPFNPPPVVPKNRRPGGLRKFLLG